MQMLLKCHISIKITDILGYLEVHKYTDHLLSMRCYGFSRFPLAAWTIFSNHLLNTYIKKLYIAIRQ